ncbi:MAG: hypothetical protein ABI767_07875 [Rhodanobacter sp.]
MNAMLATYDAFLMLICISLDLHYRASCRNQEGLVTALPKSIGRVEVAHVTSTEKLRSSRHRAADFMSHQHMDSVGLQRVGVKPTNVRHCRFIELGQVTPKLLLAQEKKLAVIPPLDDVLRNPANPDVGDAA